MAMTNANGVTYYPPQGDYTIFDNEEDYAVKGRTLGLFGKAPKKQFWHKSKTNQSLVFIKGYQEHKNLNILIIEFEDGQLSSIHPSYLKEMQGGDFGRELVLEGTEEPGAAASAEPDAVLEAAVEVEAAIAEDNASEAEFTAPVVEAEPMEAPVSKKPKEKKAKTEKIALPVDKVKMSAIVKEFASKPNPFSDNDDEVILLMDVAVVSESPLAIGDAWCGYSNTLKALGLEVGAKLEFEGKIVDKKFNKEILYKVNNPSKIIISE